jgi:hypothetical protein
MKLLRYLSALPLPIQPPESCFRVFVMSAVEDGDARVSGLASEQNS